MREALLSQNFFVGDGSKTVWEFSFAGARPDNVDGAAYLSQEDVKAAVVSFNLGVETREPLSFTWIGTNTISIQPPVPDGTQFVIYRETSPRDLLVDYTDFSTLTEKDLDTSYRHPVYLAQETRDRLSDFQSSINNLASDIEERLQGIVLDYTAADANLQAQISRTRPLEASAFSPVSWHDKVIRNSVTIPPDKNAWSFGPYLSIADGAVVEIGENSTWTLAEGLMDNRLLGYDEGLM